jgi:hypothetical protein
LPNEVWKAVYEGWCNERNLTPKEAKVTARLRQKYQANKGYIDQKYLDDSGYGRVITLLQGQDRKQVRGYSNIYIEEAILNEYL